MAAAADDDDVVGSLRRGRASGSRGSEATCSFTRASQALEQVVRRDGMSHEQDAARLVEPQLRRDPRDLALRQHGACRGERPVEMGATVSSSAE